jgi:hypothetical protein
MDTFELQEILAGCKNVWFDLGTGDGRFVCRLAGQYKERFFIGVDTCRENLHLTSRKAPPNALFVIAGAQSLPHELSGLASCVSVNFPWGSLLESLLNQDACLMNGLASVTRPKAAMDLILNADALAAAGWDLEPGAGRVERVLNGAGWKTKSRSGLEACDLRGIPTTWAKRLAFGRDPRAIRVCLRK